MILLADTGLTVVAKLLQKYALNFERVAGDAPIPGSFWGAPEAGIMGATVFARDDTPVHSILHETGHIICMCEERRVSLTGNAGSDDLEESAVCYLQVVLGDYLPGVGRERLMRDMDDWGYCFRLGSTATWFSKDADDARQWLRGQSLLGTDDTPRWTLRQ